MKNSRTSILVAGLLALGCAGQGSPAPAATVKVGSAGPLTATIANTGYINAPALVSAGMTHITAFVPTQAGATYHWSITNGTIPGVVQNAAVVFTAGAVGTVTVQCAVTLDGVQSDYTQSIPVAAALPVTPSFYGSGLGADSLANTVLGGPSLNSASCRFQTKYAGPLKGIRVFFIWSLVKTGYQAGGGGTIKVDLMADDGSAAHLPTGPSLATVSYGNILSQNDNYPELVFPYPAALKGGAFYHLVFTNVDPAPQSNYVSLDSIYSDAQTAPMQPSSSDAAFALLVRSGAGAWKLREGFTPTLELDYADGDTQGASYMEVWSANPKLICANAQVRETFTVSGPSRTFSKIKVRLQRVAGTSPLTLTLAEADGTVMAQGTVPAASVLTGVPAWVTCTLPLSHVLSTGVGYNLALSCPADTQYSAFPIRKGLDKGFAKNTCFPDGYAQFTTTGSAGWAGWDMWGTPDLTTSDLQFMFVP
jgi:hypothetical protein